MKSDKEKVRCTYCERIVSLWAMSKRLYRHNEPDGRPCRGSGSRGWQEAPNG